MQLVSHIAKREWPARWPDLFERLTALTSQGETQCELAMLVLRSIGEGVFEDERMSDARRNELLQVREATQRLQMNNGSPAPAGERSHPLLIPHTHPIPRIRLASWSLFASWSPSPLAPPSRVKLLFLFIHANRRLSIAKAHNQHQRLPLPRQALNAEYPSLFGFVVNTLGSHYGSFSSSQDPSARSTSKMLVSASLQMVRPSFSSPAKCLTQFLYE